ncbi:MAG: hypothetical protein ACRDSZ_11745 [Pseudonocardiaceae bacterium]
MTGTDTAPDPSHPLARYPSTHSLTGEVLDAPPGRMALAGELERLLPPGWVAVAVGRNGRAFCTRREPDGERAVRYVRVPGPDGTTPDRVLLDATAFDPSELITLDLRNLSEVEGGHAARAVSRNTALTADQLCFLAPPTRLDLEAVNTR